MRRNTVVLLILYCCLPLISLKLVDAAPHQPQDPVIGIVVEPFTWGRCMSLFQNEHFHKANGERQRDMPAWNRMNVVPSSGCVFGYYVNWLEAAGIRVVPVPWNQGTKALDFYLSRVNGILLPGGMVGGDNDTLPTYFEVVQYIFNQTVSMNGKGDPFFLWGTCQGFEMLQAAAVGSYSKVVQSGFVGVDPKMLPVNFTSAARTSRMFSNSLCPSEIIRAMENFPVTLNWHSKGITPEEYRLFPQLRSVFSPLATSVDGNGRVFITAIEGTDQKNIFGTQFHPERPPYEFDNDLIAHDDQSISVSQYLSLFIRGQLMKNNHSFENATFAESHLIENFPSVYVGWGARVYYLL